MNTIESAHSVAKITRVGITDDEFNRVTSYLSKKYGLRIPKEKKMMFESRFTKRLHALKLLTFKEYFDFAFNKENNEYLNFVDLATTHKTFFFREDYQFDFLKKILPEYLRKASNNNVNIWSAGCSTGEEVYTLGIVMNEFREENSSFDYRITGTDISIPSLRSAAAGSFSEAELANIPVDLQKKYFQVSETNPAKPLVFSNSTVTSRINLGVLNLNNPVYNLKPSFDFIFCRNVIIYFDAATQKRVLEKLVGKLKPGGFLFLGHSETAIGSTLPIRSVRPTIYQKNWI